MKCLFEMIIDSSGMCSCVQLIGAYGFPKGNRNPQGCRHIAASRGIWSHRVNHDMCACAITW